MKELEVQQKIQLQASKLRNILLRNNSGAFKDATGRVVFYGLGNISKKHNQEIKSSDLIGGTKIIVTPDMVGTEILVFTAIEVKEEGWKYKNSQREKAQQKFIDIIKEMNGIAGFCQSVDDYNNLILRYLSQAHID